MIALLTACLFFEILVRLLNIASAKARAKTMFGHQPFSTNGSLVRTAASSVIEEHIATNWNPFCLESDPYSAADHVFYIILTMASSSNLSCRSRRQKCKETQRQFFVQKFESREFSKTSSFLFLSPECHAFVPTHAWEQLWGNTGDVLGDQSKPFKSRVG